MNAMSRFKNPSHETNIIKSNEAHNYIEPKHPFSFGDHKKSFKLCGLGGHQNGFFLFRLHDSSSSYIELVFFNKKLTLIYVAIFNGKMDIIP
jgi:hypothetical protein